VLNTLRDSHNAGTLQMLDPAQCLLEYGANIQSTRRHLLLITNETAVPEVKENTFINGSYVYWAYRFYANDASTVETAVRAYEWICSGLPPVTGTPICENQIDEIRK
jgi:hypothetical protein